MSENKKNFVFSIVTTEDKLKNEKVLSAEQMKAFRDTYNKYENKKNNASNETKKIELFEIDKQKYISDVRKELLFRGVDHDKIDYVIDKTGFMDVMADDECAEVQMHYAVSDAVVEILVTAAMA